MILTALAVFASAALIVIAATAALNTLSFPRLSRQPAPECPPRVSLLVPARDEAAVIGETIRALLAQDYPGWFEVIVLDDHSSDGTGDLAWKAADGDPRLRVIEGRDLPPGWAGKVWACHQLSQEADGDVLVFTDADVRWQPGALRALMGAVEQSGADLYGIWPTQHTVTLAERLVVSQIALAVMGYLPVLAVHHIPWPVFAAANGQCMAFRRTAYRKIGGHAAVRAEVLEDVIMARRIKRMGLRLRIGDGAGLITCRMYDGWPAVRDGFAKNILAGHGDSVPFLIASGAFHWLIFVLPWVWLLTGWGYALPGWPGWPVALVGLGIGVRALTAAATRQRVSDALLMPVSVVLMTLIAARSIWWAWRYGGPQWKGRTIARRTRAGRGERDE